MKWTRKASAISRSRGRHPLVRVLVLVREQFEVALDLGRHAIAVGAGALLVERLADIDILIVPGEGIAEAVAERFHAVRPIARILDRRGAGRSESRASRAWARSRRIAVLVSGLASSQATWRRSHGHIPTRPRPAIAGPGRSRRIREQALEHWPAIRALGGSFVAVNRDLAAGRRRCRDTFPGC